MCLAQLIRTIWQSSWSGPVFGFAFVAAICGFAYLAGARQRDSGVTPDGLYIDPKYLDFGEVWEQEGLKLTLPVVNRSREPIDLQPHSDACACLSVSPSRLYLQPGDRGELQLSIDLTGKETQAVSFSRREEGSTSRLLSTSDSTRRRMTIPLVLSTTPPYYRAQKSLVGIVTSPIHLSARRCWLGEFLNQNGAERATEIQARPYDSAQTLTAHSDLDFVFVAIIRDRLSITVRPREGMKPGPFQGTIRLVAVLPNGRALPPVPVRIEGTIVSDLQLTPESIPLGPKNLGTMAEESVTIRSRSKRAIRSISCQHASDTLTIQSRLIEQGEAAIVDLKVHCQKASHQSMAVIVRATDGGGTERVATLLVTYYGLGPAAGAQEKDIHTKVSSK